ncbi:hypothetical protein DTO021C3_3184 [Paecilomyces variotii]|nr:hypothetical protein DTO195F2_1155 [Paecilomyces variotii]KAJ9289358.1 hypothetical protein DTO021C3_3184 [Paecilomyces variotii]KAJ9305588.1 hypothetical protein DTO217A2_4987 [Paecilomyces variotii]KAJ9370746.1 hypothetical protein DTO282E5_4506 [Paecilomyces variotii]
MFWSFLVKTCRHRLRFMDEQNVPYDISTEVDRRRDFNQRQLFKPSPAATRNEDVVKVLRLRQEETKFVVYADTYESQGIILEHLRNTSPSWNVAMMSNRASDKESRISTSNTVTFHLQQKALEIESNVSIATVQT